MKPAIDYVRLNNDPQLPARVVQSLRRDATRPGFAYLASAADIIELLLDEQQAETGVCVNCGDPIEYNDEDGMYLHVGRDEVGYLWERCCFPEEGGERGALTATAPEVTK